MGSGFEGASSEQRHRAFGPRKKNIRILSKVLDELAENITIPDSQYAFGDEVGRVIFTETIFDK